GIYRLSLPDALPIWAGAGHGADPRAPDVSDEQRRFEEDGYVVVPSVVARSLVDRAMQAINHWLDSDFDSAERLVYHARTFVPDLDRKSTRLNSSHVK